MVRVNLLREALVVVAAGHAALGAFACAESFDMPLQKTVIDLGRSSYTTSNIHLSCYYYPDFMVKALNDPGVKGTEGVWIVPVVSGHLPPCRRAHSADERLLGKEVGGYFKGIKGQLLFMDASDGSEGGIQFSIFDLKTGEKMFEDSALYWYSKQISNVTFGRTSDGRQTMSYRRVVEGDCSIAKDGAGCWEKFRQKYRLLPATTPKCIGYEVPGKKKWVLGDAGVPPDAIGVPSAIAYPVVVELFPRVWIEAVAGPVRCSPVD